MLPDCFANCYSDRSLDYALHETCIDRFPRDIAKRQLVVDRASVYNVAALNVLGTSSLFPSLAAHKDPETVQSSIFVHCTASFPLLPTSPSLVPTSSWFPHEMVRRAQPQATAQDLAVKQSLRSRNYRPYITFCNQQKATDDDHAFSHAHGDEMTFL